ncbi:hypothetical protein CVT24_011439 [Panaeolus cyanescens]|uniref:Dol-P-Man:Man(5)GlcNAc(2)-PP-Dol alpha-1,3-mannosyltransferase n=1 Tax=Panaeolus cyanescens TaxID=181874 RepID=A0A409VGB6_9AGAR|nr:hypothetical protein CVT24_011439 [Panaeolus cyanescens]
MANSSLNRHGVVQTGLACIHSLLFDSRYFWILAGLVILGEVALTSLIVQYVPYTEIDWETYMIQIKVFLGGQHNYSLITGPTGPLVYPAGHVRVHQFLYDITGGGINVPLAQWIYSTLYIASLFLSCSIYRLAGNVPNWAILLLPLSKRLHSIYVLRLFNDCWAVVAVQAAIVAFQRGYFDTGIMLFSFALSVKMSILLYLPGLLVILVKRRGLVSTFMSMVTIAATQILFAIPFLKEDPWAYLRCAFDFERVFLYKWTVNWRFFDEETFLSPRLSVALLVGHLSLLVAFGLFKWCELDGGTWFVIRRALKRPLLPAEIALTTPDFVATVLFTSNLLLLTMAKKKSEKPQNVAANGNTISSTPQVVFPDVAAKTNLECQTILDDQIIVIDNLFSLQECKSYVKFIDSLPLELTPPKKRGEAERVNHRFSVSSLDFAQKLHALLLPHLPSFPYPTSMRRPAAPESPRHPQFCNSNIRVYKYTASQYFGPHYDDSVKDPLTGAKSEWTLLIYLTGIEDGVEGGETLFYKEERGKPRKVITPQLKRGTALLHRYVITSDGNLVAQLTLL